MTDARTLFVRPRPGFLVCRPASEGGGHLPEEGAKVPATSYWRRRLKTGEVLPVTAAPQKPEKKGKE